LPIPEITVEKLTNGHDADDAPGPSIAPGEAITWTYIVTNTGSVDLTDITLEDDQEGSVGCPRNALVPQESMTCTVNAIATAGEYTNLATASALYETVVVSDTDRSHYRGQGYAVYLPLILR
jgi:hypothetical protein